MRFLLIFTFLGFLSLRAQSWERPYTTPTTLGLTAQDNIMQSSIQWDNYIYSSQIFSDFTSGFVFSTAKSTRLIKMDLNGNIIDSTQIFNGFFGSLSVFNNKLISLHFNSGLTSLEVYNSDLQPINIISFPNLTFYTIQNEQDSLILNCVHNNTSDYYSFTFDQNLNQINQRMVPYSSFLAVDSVAPMYGLSHLYQFPNTKNYWLGAMHKQYLLDSNFIPIQTMTYPDGGSDLHEYATTITAIQTENGDVISSAAYRYTYIQGLQIKNKYYLSVRKWREMTIIDSVKLTHLSLPDTQTSISQTAISRINRKEFYAAVGSGILQPHSKILLAKMDTSLNVLWFKTYEHPDKNLVFYEVRATSDGGALIAGTIFNWVTQDDAIGYLIRIDSTGAILTTNDPLMRVEKDFIVYPNPAKHEIYFSAQHDSKPIDIQIFNALGTLVYQEKNAQQTRLSLEGFSTGIYTYRVRCEDRVTSGKVVKE